MSTTTTVNVEMKLDISSLPMDRASSCSSTKEALQPQVFGQSLQKSWSSSACLDIASYVFHLKWLPRGASLGVRDSCVPGFPVSLGVGGQLLQKGVGLTLRSFDTVGPHDAGGPVEIEHHH